jgi:signal transduction histidine kinase
VTLGQQIGSVVQNARLFEAVLNGQERLQILSRRLVEVQEQERHHIARDLHDEVGQILTGLNLSLEMVTRLPPDQMGERLEQARTMVSELMQIVREMSLQLRPPMLDDLGLLSALLWHIERYTVQTGIQVALKHNGLEQQRFVPEIEITVYRMVQEALTNVARYADVHEAVVRLWARSDVLSVQIEDQGCGFDPVAVLAQHTSSGLSGMRERALLLGGELSIEAAPGEGCRLTVVLPLGEQETGAAHVPKS